MKHIKLFEQMIGSKSEFLLNLYKKGILDHDDKYKKLAIDQGFDLYKHTEDLIWFCIESGNHNHIKELDEDRYEEEIEETVTLTINFEKLKENGIDKPLRNIRGISCLKNLSSLDCSGNKITSLARIEELPEMFILDCGSNEIENLEPLRNLNDLNILRCEKNNITSVEPLSKLTELTYLNLGTNNISDLNVLSELKELSALHFANNKVTNLEKIVILPMLWKITVDNNPLPADLISGENNGGMVNTHSIAKYYGIEK